MDVPEVGSVGLVASPALLQEVVDLPRAQGRLRQEHLREKETARLRLGTPGGEGVCVSCLFVCLSARASVSV